MELTEGVPADAWQAGRLDIARYSASQKKEPVLHGAPGWMDLPGGPGALWPIFLAARWIHAGKGSIIGMGQFRIEGLPGSDS